MSSYKKLWIGFCVILFVLFAGLSMRKQGIRTYPTVDDFSAEGGGQRYAKAESLYIELVSILPVARRVSSTWRACSLGILWTDTIESNPYCDSLNGLVSLVSGAGGVDLDTIKECDKITGAPDIDTLASCMLATIENGDIDTLRYANNGNGNPEHGILKTSIVTIGHVGETTTDFAFATAANTTEQTLATDTIPAWARIVDVCLITTEAVAGITTSFSCDVGDGAGTDEYADATDMKALNAVIASPISESMLVMPISSATTIYVNGTPAAENWSAMSAGEFTLITTYLDYGSLRAKYP